MRRVKITDPAFAYDAADPEGFRSGMFRTGPEVGAEQSGASLYELPPGQAVCRTTTSTGRRSGRS